MYLTVCATVYLYVTVCVPEHACNYVFVTVCVADCLAVCDSVSGCLYAGVFNSVCNMELHVCYCVSVCV